jgi:hypothetical protein
MECAAPEWGPFANEWSDYAASRHAVDDNLIIAIPLGQGSTFDFSNEPFHALGVNVTGSARPCKKAVAVFDSIREESIETGTGENPRSFESENSKGGPRRS